jgi:hypothetical protein
MLHKRQNVAIIAAMVSTLAVMVFASAPASAVTIPFTFKNWALWGSLTPKKLNEPVVLPKGSTFNGTSSLTRTETELFGTMSGSLFVPPFNATLKILGLPENVGVTFTQVGKAEGTIVAAPASSCHGTRFVDSCVTLNVNAKAEIGLTAVGILGIDVPTHCETSEPITFPLSDTLPLGEVLAAGPSFTGTVTIPSIECGGLSGLALAPVFTGLMSGPENPYVLHIGPHEPAAPTVTTEEPTNVSQVSAKLHGQVDPTGEAVSDCRFEYGTTASYGASVPCDFRPNAGFSVYAPLGGLSESTTYHARVAATNALGTSYGADQAFTTLSFSGAPEYGQCVAQKKGNYTDSGCTTQGERKGQPVEHAGGFEFQPGPAPTCVAQKKGEFTDSACAIKSAKPRKGTYEKAPGAGFTSSTGTVTLDTQELGRSVVCSASTGAGEVTSVNAGVERITLTGCEVAGKKCASQAPNGTPSGKAGVITTNLLHTRLLGPVAGEVWTELTSAEHDPYLTEFACEGVLFRTTGSLSGIQAGDVGSPSLTSTTTFAPEEGEQDLSTAVSEDGGKTWVGPDLTSVTALSSNTSASNSEIRP